MDRFGNWICDHPVLTFGILLTAYTVYFTGWIIWIQLSVGW